jgi:hypothetical protein
VDLAADLGIGLPAVGRDVRDEDPWMHFHLPPSLEPDGTGRSLAKALT